MTLMGDGYRHRVTLIAGCIVLALLAAITIIAPPDQSNLVPWLLFCGIAAFAMSFGISVGEGSVSLMPMTVLAAFLVMGLVPAGWVTFVSAIVHGGIRYRRIGDVAEQREPESPSLVARTATNATMHTLSILAGGAIFQLVGGTTPLAVLDVATVLRLALLGFTFLAVNYVIAGVYIATRGRIAVRSYLNSLPKVALYEGVPIFFAVLMAQTYLQLGVGYFILLSVNLVVGSLISHNLAQVNRRLGRRVKELGSLQAVGQALSTSLDIETVALSIYAQVAELMPARGFHVALYDSRTDEVSFPLVIEKGDRVQWRSRSAGNGLTEYVLRNRLPLLIRRDVGRKLTELGLDRAGREAACWLGVPILAGTESLGVIAVQSHDTPGVYDASHQNVLQTIAIQAAVAIQNARLYARTDESLARRVQELDSILRTTRDGFLLLDLDWRVLTVNRTLADWVNVSQSELIQQTLNASLGGGEPLIRLIGYTANALRTDCEALAEGEREQREAIVLLGSAMRHVQRTLTPVRDQGGAITRWLLAFRDMTEEIELERLKDDMTDMLVHDLRGRLTAIIGSVALMTRVFDQQDEEAFERLQSTAQQSSDQILHIVNQLLDISRLESEQLPLQPEVLEVEGLFKDAQVRFAPLATGAQIALTLDIAPGLPPLHVDPALIRRVLDNLIDNAIKFTPDGGHVRLWARLDQDQAPEGILLGITDTGPGIPPEAQSRVFVKFQQVASIKGRRGGSGLGLAFCKLAVEAHGGRIWVESKVREGSTFVMALPVVHGQTHAG